MSNLQQILCCAAWAIPLWVAISISDCQVAQAQPGGQELGQLQEQLRQIQSRINTIQGEQNRDDPFGQRVRAVGRQRTARPKIEDEDTLTIRFYDLSDIFSVAPQYPATAPNDLEDFGSAIFGGGGGPAQGGGFGGGGVFSRPPTFPQQQAQTLSLEAARVSVAGLIDAIKTTVGPKEWEEGKASVSVLGNTLLISATDPTHEQISNLLNLIREHWGKLKTVSVQAYWIKSTPAQIRELLNGDQVNRVVGKVDSSKWRAFFDKANEEKLIAYSASLTGHNGQTLNTVSGRQRFVVVDADPLYSVTGSLSAHEDLEEAEDEEMLMYVKRSIAGIKPIRNTFQEGAALQISPFATRGGNFVILDLHTRVNEVIEDEAPAKTTVTAHTNEGVPVSVDLDNTNYVSYRLSTTVRCPKDAIILAGGMTYDSRVKDSNDPNLYLFVRSRIHTIDEDTSDRAID